MIFPPTEQSLILCYGTHILTKVKNTTIVSADTNDLFILNVSFTYPTLPTQHTQPQYRETTKNDYEVSPSAYT